MTRQELNDFIESLNGSITNMQDQANYWLDSKEQLVMESEMHNKMIASLVTVLISDNFIFLRSRMLNKSMPLLNRKKRNKIALRVYSKISCMKK